MDSTTRIVDVILNRPHRILHDVVRAVLRRASNHVPWAERRCYDWLMVERPNYAYGLKQASDLAQRLGLPGFTALEFGVAGGNGLLALEHHADHYQRRFNITIDVAGFDTGVGMPRTTDHRDSPYQWFEGCYTMDETAIHSVLRSAQLILGDVSETVGKYQPKYPLGFIAFDLDYYTSTVAALAILEGADFKRWLPRVQLYFDDVTTIPDVGELLAIREWNESHFDRKLGRPMGLRDQLFATPHWAERVYEAHFFDHPDYSTPVLSLSHQQLPLR